jgi:hypothetical protein
MGQDPSDIREEIEHTRAEMGDTVDALAHKADVKSRVKESFADKKERMKTQMQGTTSRLGDATPDSGQVKDGAGMLLPSTRMEDERVGPIAEEVKEKAIETGQEAVERGKDVAGQVAEQAAETAQEAGQEQAEQMKKSVTSNA